MDPLQWMGAKIQTADKNIPSQTHVSLMVCEQNLVFGWTIPLKKY